MLSNNKSISEIHFMRGWILFLMILGFFLFGSSASAFAISNFQFDVPTKTVKMGESVEIPIKISTDKDLEVKSADLWLIFDQTALEVQTINPGDFFTETFNQLIGEKLYIAGYFTDTTTTKSGDGVYATVYMTPKKTGDTTITFDCRGNQVPDTSKINVNPQNPENIIDCSTTSQASLKITAVAADGSATTVTPTPSVGGGVNPTGNIFMPDVSGTITPTPSTLPETGYFDSTLYYILSGGLFIGVGGILRKLYA
ncbi:MAG: cohesin domain-containing protein [Patescibacteria group bacterium]